MHGVLLECIRSHALSGQLPLSAPRIAAALAQAATCGSASAELQAAMCSCAQELLSGCPSAAAQAVLLLHLLPAAAQEAASGQAAQSKAGLYDRLQPCVHLLGAWLGKPSAAGEPYCMCYAC